jgi:DNA-binding CsgD family transcriptional regulator
MAIPAKGKRGRGAVILAWIAANRADAATVAARFGLAISTARAYVRRGL